MVIIIPAPADVRCFVAECVRVAVAVATVVTVEVSGRRIAAIAAVIVCGQVYGGVHVGVVQSGVVIGGLVVAGLNNSQKINTKFN